MELIYKTLVEIKLLHEFFLTREDSSSLFAEADPVQRALQLEEAFAIDRETINRDISFEFPEKFESIYVRYGLKIIPSYSGCRILCKVKRQILPDRTEVFAPLVPLPDMENIFILLLHRNNLPDIYTNSRINFPLPARYIFSNDTVTGTKQYPFLTNPISSFDANYNYEQGELSINTNGKLQEAWFDDAGNVGLFELNHAVTRFASENDRLLIPTKFTYSITHHLPVRHLHFELKDASGTTLNEQNFDRDQPVRELMLDFSSALQPLQFSGNTASSLLRLFVSGDNGYADIKTFVADEQLYRGNTWGVIHLRTKPANPQFHLLDNDGFIVKRIDPSGVWTEAPVYEIPVKSRLGHLRYLNNKGKPLDLSVPMQNFLKEENGALISRMPVSLAHYSSQSPDSAGTNTKYLPHPVGYDLKRDNNQRIYFEIYVPESEMFPIIH